MLGRVCLKPPDALSVMLSRLQITVEVYIDENYHRFDAMDKSLGGRIHFFIVGDGGAWLYSEGQRPQHLSVGNIVVFIRNKNYVLSARKPLLDVYFSKAQFLPDEGVSGNILCGCFNFKTEAAWPLLDSLSDIIILRLEQLSESTAIRPLVGLMASELKRQQPGSYAVISQLAHLLFIEILRDQIELGEPRLGLLKAMSDPGIGKALFAIHQHPEQHWTLKSLASESNVSRSLLIKRFHDLIGVPPLHYLANWRMQQAIYFLQSTSLSVWAIAERSGYESEAAFRKAFKKIIGETPGEIRRNVNQ